jgi:hypothetical protein
MDDLRTVFHLPINDAAKKVRKKRRALVILVRRNKQQQQEQKTKEIFFLLWVFWVHLFLGATFTLFVFCSETDLAFHSKLTTLIIVLCLSSK